MLIKVRGAVNLGKIISMNASKVRSRTVGQEYTYVCFEDRVLYG